MIGGSSNVLLNLILLNSPMGVLGAALATLVSYVLVYVYRALDTKKYLYMKVNYPKMFLNLALIGVMSAAIMLMDNCVALNVINCVVFIVICAVNFRSAAQAIKLFIPRRSGDPDAESEE